jgi:hypothetical protein
MNPANRLHRLSRSSTDVAPPNGTLSLSFECFRLCAASTIAIGDQVFA